MDFDKSSSQLACAVALLVACASLLACGGSSSSAAVTNPTLAVADTNNSRVLIYSTPVVKTENAVVVLGRLTSSLRTGIVERRFPGRPH